MRLRDRDAIVTKERLIFRVLGYEHPREAYFCDVEYAPASIFRSHNSKAFRCGGQQVFYKFYEDEGWRFVQDNFRHYMIPHEMLGKNVIGVNASDILEARKPEKKLGQLLENQYDDALVLTTKDVLGLMTCEFGLQAEDFGVFGSMLHGFHHPSFSDIDLIIYGRDEIARLRSALKVMFEDDSSSLKNEFATNNPLAAKEWKFRNISPKEFAWHQRRKLIYGLFSDRRSGRTIKVEFEPVKAWNEINNDYNSDARFQQKGWVKMLAHVTDDKDAPFTPSIYAIKPLKILHGRSEAIEACRIVSYLEEFRMQVARDETVYVEGNLEEVTTRSQSFFQVALSCCPRYYEQALKKVAGE
jgi:predicted nucleotidyltransferase